MIPIIQTIKNVRIKSANKYHKKYNSNVINFHIKPNKYKEIRHGTLSDKSNLTIDKHNAPKNPLNGNYSDKSTRGVPRIIISIYDGAFR